jgi:hypothetical protein
MLSAVSAGVRKEAVSCLPNVQLFAIRHTECDCMCAAFVVTHHNHVMLWPCVFVNRVRSPLKAQE